MNKTVSIRTIKEELMDALLENVQIMNFFPKYDDIKKTTDYINRNIFNHLNTEEDYPIIDTSINFDVSYERGAYIVAIIVKAHKDLVISNDNVNSLDVMSGCIKEITEELYPYYKGYTDRASRRKDKYAERVISFRLYEQDIKTWLEECIKSNDKDYLKPLREFFDEVNGCVNKCKNCSSDNSAEFIKKLRNDDEFKRIIKEIVI